MAVEKIRTYVSVGLGLFTLVSIVIGGATGYARLQDKTEQTEEAVADHSARIRAVEDNYLEQRTHLNYLVEETKESKELSKGMQELLIEIKSKL